MGERRAIGDEDIGPQAAGVGEGDVHRVVELAVIVEIRAPQHGIGHDVAHVRLVVVVAHEADVGGANRLVDDGRDHLRPVGHPRRHLHIGVGQDPVGICQEQVCRVGGDVFSALRLDRVDEGFQFVGGRFGVVLAESSQGAFQPLEQAVEDAVTVDVARFVEGLYISDEALDGHFGGDGMQLVVVHRQLFGHPVDGELDMPQPTAVVAGADDGRVADIDRLKERLVLVAADHQAHRLAGVDQFLGDGFQAFVRAAVLGTHVDDHDHGIGLG